MRRPLPGHRRPRLRAQPHPVGHDGARRAAAAQPGLADRPAPTAARHLRDRGGRRRPAPGRHLPRRPAADVSTRPTAGPAGGRGPGLPGLRGPALGVGRRRRRCSCAAGHRFDRARQGHVTLLPPGHRPPSGDSAEMVADRVAFLEAGHYAGVTRALADAVADGPAPRALLDLGGGTGHHLAGVLDRLPDAVGVVLDSSRVRRAPRRTRPSAGRGRGGRHLGPAAGRRRRGRPGAGGVRAAQRARDRPRAAVRTVGSSSSRRPPTTWASWSGRSGCCASTRTRPRAWRPRSSPIWSRSRRRRTGSGSGWTGRPWRRWSGMGPHARHLARDDVRTALAGFAEPVDVTVSVRDRHLPDGVRAILVTGCRGAGPGCCRRASPVAPSSAGEHRLSCRP